jgi:hypothetical protein
MLNAVNSFCHSVHNLLSPLLSKDLHIKIYRTITFPVVLYGFETWNLELRERHGMTVLDNRVLERIFGSKRGEIIGG